VEEQDQGVRAEGVEVGAGAADAQGEAGGEEGGAEGA
jgi:hypothetical protein